jgi:hypothetical protein
MNSSYYDNIPAGPTPPGVESNFDTPMTRALELHIAIGICIAVVTIIVWLRCYVKLVVTKTWGWDDCTSGLLSISFSCTDKFRVMFV